MPTTPTCQSGEASTRPRCARRSSGSASAMASASRRISPSTAWRSRLRASSTSASSRARRSSVVVSSSSASRGWPSRPAALMRGASRKPISVAPMRVRSHAGDAHQRVEPGPARARAAPRAPRAPAPRFSPSSGTMSATVASATRSSSRLDDRAVGAGRGRRAPRRASRRRRCRTGRPGSRRGRAAPRRGQSGSSSAGRWWSVITSARPSSARARGGGDGRDAAVDRHQQPAALGREPLDGLDREPVALVEPARQERLDGAAERRDDGRRDAVAQMPSTS